MVQLFITSWHTIETDVETMCKIYREKLPEYTICKIYLTQTANHLVLVEVAGN